VVPPGDSDEVEKRWPGISGRLHYVFPCSNGGVLDYWSIYGEIRKIQIAIGKAANPGELGYDFIRRHPNGTPTLSKTGVMQAKYSPHCFRHFYVSYLADKGFSLEEVAEIVGHSHKDMTRQYLHFFKNPQREKERKERFRKAFLQLAAEGAGQSLNKKACFLEQ